MGDGGAEVSGQGVQLGGSRRSLLGPDRVLPRHVSDLTHRTNDLLRGGPLLLSRNRDLFGSSSGLINHPGDLLQRPHHIPSQLRPRMHLPRPLLRSQNRRVRLRLNLRHNRLNLTRRLLRPLRQLPNLRRHHSKPTPMLTRTSRLNRRIQRQQIRLIRKLINHLQNPTNLLTLLPQPQRPRRNLIHPRRNLIHRLNRRRHRRPTLLSKPQRLSRKRRHLLSSLRNLSRRRRQLRRQSVWPGRAAEQER